MAIQIRKYAVQRKADDPYFPAHEMQRSYIQKMANDIRNGSRIAISFTDAVRFHKLIAAMEIASWKQSRWNVG